MPRAPDPHNLRNLAKAGVGAAAAGAVIELDRECLGCGYNLRGLRLGYPCPECGMPTDVPESIDDPLSLMPKRVIVAFIRGCWVASLCVAALLALIVLQRFEVVRHEVIALSLAALSIIWLGAAVWLTPAFALKQATVRGFARRSRLRQAARWLQLGWVAAGCALALKTILNTPPPGLPPMLNALQTLGFVAGMAGIVILSILLERLAEWARDGSAEKMFNWAAWGLPVATFLLFVEPPHAAVGVLLFALWIFIACTFPYALLSLSGAVTLSIMHAYEHTERMKRREERAQQYHENVVRTVATMDESRVRHGTKL